jgi:hypothetical protein
MNNPEYTSIWTQGFDQEGVQKYDDKFRSRWEKNIKHKEQIAFIGKYLEDWMYWCDAPIGSGRLMGELKTQRMLGYDISDGFLEHNRKKGITCEKGDLFDFGKKYKIEFDVVTSFHSIFAFNEYRSIVKGFVDSLKLGGIVIVDITNQLHSDATQDIKSLIFEDASNFPDGMTREEITGFFGSIGCDVLEIQANDYWDNYFFFNWRYLKGNVVTKRLKKYLWNILNFLYFRFSLDGFFRKLEDGRPEHLFTKYLVAAVKR